jgi:hypothetical protein
MTIRVALDFLSVDAFSISNQRWNGFVMPSFTFEQAQILSGEYGADSLYYNKEEDAFILTREYEDEEDEVFPAREVDGIKVYDIGAGSWTWRLDLP